MHVFSWERWKKYIKECSATSFDLATLQTIFYLYGHMEKTQDLHRLLKHVASHHKTESLKNQFS